ncbi:protein kinase [Nonomuraea sp. NPDC050663]|uniref:protein kinase domain-containing protein n=1 Tax=Nonomuraea sp. NPDC050663 TaxID=3364370 RepID=UPI0037A8478D
MTEARALRRDDPRELAGYRLTGVLGDGGQGTVYLGQRGGRHVAVKVLHARLVGDRRAVRRFLAEAATAARIEGAGTARVVDSGMAEERPYLISEYVDGPSLQQHVQRYGPLDGDELDELAIGTIGALSAIHRAEIVHRDFKPSNVLLGPDGPRVIDFGIARTVDSATTATSSVVGTPGYMAPEQIAGEDATAASDVFAWAATIAFAATGSSLFSAANIPAVMHRVLTAEPDLSDVERPLRSVLTDCLRKDPARRPIARQVHARLTRQAPATPAPLPASVRRRRLLAAGALALILAVGALKTMWWPDRLPEASGPELHVTPANTPGFGQALGDPFGPAGDQVTAMAVGSLLGDPIVAAAGGGEIHLLRPGAERPAYPEIPVGSPTVTFVAVTEVDGRAMVVYVAGGVLRTWNVAEAEPGRFFTCDSENPPVAIAGERAYLGCPNGRVITVDLRSGRPVGEPQVFESVVTALAWDGFQLVVGTGDGHLLRGGARAAAGAPVTRIGHLGGARIAVVTTDGRVTVYGPDLAEVVYTAETAQPLADVIERGGELVTLAGGQGLSAQEGDREARLLAERHEVTAIAAGELGGRAVVVAAIGGSRLRAWNLDR